MPYSQETRFPTLIFDSFFSGVCNSERCFVWWKWTALFHPKPETPWRCTARNGSSCWTGNLRRNTSLLLGFSITTADAWNAEILGSRQVDFWLFFSDRFWIDNLKKIRKKWTKRRKLASESMFLSWKKWNHSKIHAFQGLQIQAYFLCRREADSCRAIKYHQVF